MGTDLLMPATAFAIKRETKPIYDYGKLYQSRSTFKSFRPQSMAEAIAFMKYAFEQKLLLRFRGSGHTFNGVTMPEAEETLVYTNQINHFRFEKNGTLTAGSGAIVWDVRDLVRAYGHDLKVYNGGWAGPSVGGYINAGGFGKGNLSKTNGGLWESINWIKLVDAKGQIHKIDKKHPVFPWIFGSYGQLGLVLEANFQVVPKKPLFFFLQNIPLKSLSLPLGLEGTIPKRQTDDPAENLYAPDATKPNILFWFSLLIDPKQEASAWEALQNWVLKNEEMLQPEGGWYGPLLNNQPIGYHYVIKYKNFHPPLIYPFAKDFLVIGIMSRLNITKLGATEQILRVENEFIQLAKEGNYRLYLQAENFGKTVDFEAYYGSKIHQQFFDIKAKFDPNHRINRNVFFKVE